MKTILIIGLLVLFSSTVFGADKAEPLLVEKQHFTTENFTTVSGTTLQQVDIGWESYGELNKAKDNVILITHYFSGTSHAAGKYAADDAVAGYWDALIGPGKAIDTNKYFVISSDTLVNANWHDPNVITTGPASINPATGKPYGLDFPVVTITDFVNVQKRLVESLGITKLHAVMGASMGSFQALEWATRYPEQVERLIHVIGAATMDAWTVAALEKWALPIRLDKNWQQGNYYGKERPLDGLAATMLNITQDAMHPIIYNASFADFNVHDDGALKDIRTLPKLSQTLAQRAMARAKTQDANHVLYLVRASQLFTAGMEQDLSTALKKVTAKTLLLPATNDLLLRPENMRTVYESMKTLGKDVQFSEIEGGWGHLDGIFSILPKAQLISEFLEE
ncbi:homoserine O-acetyltransferase [Pseudoalteromonas sp. BSi20311]|mgnify:FL=1|jgi:homoserine O-acetyltransferase|uniref:E22 family MetX-like putative esterase n=1 Tax=Pseudoalteromonas sp. BSi20311 TaxID=383911 RepID=UPI00023186DA|nr:homoserine O-acetyltransferase [Pseudoalteromonas sp. BSi20311]GAA62402.1 homoserine O-acetyltransferase [Pseudoalteromonas sp. BSi20311]HCP97220.1 homoserine O-acetyltransferase [Pseudoalteromonas sp.]|tara:strand:+ start:593 stop:1774 length:1182 start_codon:yes stop_codon:yes gene_type:complete